MVACGRRRSAPLPTGRAPERLHDGFVFTTPVETPAYLAWLWRRFESAGGVIEQRTVESLADAAGAARVVVNCAGLGAGSRR